MHARHVWWGLAIGVALLAATLRIESLDQRPLWLDERYTAKAVHEAPTLAALWRGGSLDDYQHPPLAYLLPWLTAHDGANVVRLRAPSVAMGLASIAAIAALGVLLFGRWAGLAAAFLAALSLYHVDMSEQARPYMTAVALTSGLYLALFDFVLRGRRVALAFFAACAIAALYTYHLALLHVAIAAAIAGLHVLRRRSRDDLVALAVAAGAICVAYAPQVGNLLGFLSSQGAAPNHALALSPRFLDALVQRWGAGDGLTLRLYEIALVIGIVRAGMRRDLVSLGLLGWAVAPLLLFTARPFTKYFDIRFLISSLPVFFLLAGAGVDAIARGAAWLAARATTAARAPQIAAIAVGVAAAIAFGVPAANLYLRYRALDRGCGDFVHYPEIFAAQDHLCANHLLLNTAAAEQQWIVRRLRPEFALPPERLDGYVGRFRFAAGPPIDVTRDGDALIAQVEGRRAYALVPESPTRFAYRVLGERMLDFELGPDGRATALVLETNGNAARAERER